jgi:tripartite ATP-independent transporter DctM subunit
MTLSIALIFFVLMFLGMPVAFGIGIASLIFFVLSATIPTSIGVQRIATSTQSFPLLAVPLFVLAGNLMNATGITRQLIALSMTLTGWIRGGLAQVAILLSALMGGVSGSAVADAAMEARILGPSMLKEGYSKGYTCAAISVGSLITATIPPSIGLILYGFLGNVSIGRLFVGGVIPGLLMTLFLMVTAYLVARRRDYRVESARPPRFGEILTALNHSKWALIFPIILIVGIRYGIFTPSEAGAFAVAYAVVIGFFVHRELDFPHLMEALQESVADIGMIMLIIMFSSMLGYVIALERVPQTLTQLLVGVTTNKQLMLVLIVIFLLFLGMLLESTVIVLLLTPILVPVINGLGVDPVHFGLVMMTCVTFGSMTPPVGVAMFTVCGLLGCSMDEYTREAIPFFIAIVLLVLLMVFVPGVVLFLPNLLM